MGEYGKKAMWSPQGEYREVDHPAVEAALRDEGWIDGHEYWSRKAQGEAPKPTLPSAPDLDAKAAETKAAEATEARPTRRLRSTR